MLLWRQHGQSAPPSPRGGVSGVIKSAATDRSLHHNAAKCKHRLYNTPLRRKSNSSRDRSQLARGERSAQ
eukprot:6735993-Alexandrium_andersonii.AAC.1